MTKVKKTVLTVCVIGPCLLWLCETVNATPLEADFDLDGDVDEDDLLIWKSNYGLVFCPTGGCEGDADFDGDTDGDDFLIWQSQYGSVSGSASVTVPEPASVVLLIAALVSVVVLARRL